MCIFAPLKTRDRLGLLAQLVQSIWFTPRGSGVRIPQGPQKLSDYSESFLFYAYSWEFTEILDQYQNLGIKQKVLTI